MFRRWEDHLWIELTVLLHILKGVVTATKAPEESAEAAAQYPLLSRLLSVTAALG